MMIPKHQRVRLIGKKLSALNKAIHERDGNRCVICDAYVESGEKFHHEPGGIYRSDEAEKGVTICQDCHSERHFGKNSKKVRVALENYLRSIYGAAGAAKE